MKKCRNLQDVLTAVHGQAKLATLLGVSQQAVSKWVQQGFVPLSSAIKLHEQFKVPIVTLIHPQYVPLFSARRSS